MQDAILVDKYLLTLERQVIFVLSHRQMNLANHVASIHNKEQVSDAYLCQYHPNNHINEIFKNVGNISVDSKNWKTLKF